MYRSLTARSPKPVTSHIYAIRRRALALVALLAALAPLPALAVGVPMPGAATPQTVKLPDGPASVRGLADHASVDIFTAQVSYSVPIEVPHAVGGFAPTVSLGYSGALGNGPLGIGWSVASAHIRRSERKGVPSFTAADELDLIGIGDGRLVAADDGSFRVEGRGNGIKVVSQGSGFVVLGGDGTRYVLGTTAEGRQESAGRIAAWLLESATDVGGQTITFHYNHDQGQVYLSEIDWGPKQSFALVLQYVSRPDVTLSYRSGFAVSTALRLQRIEVRSFGEVLRAYQLDYDEQLSLSRLKKVHQTGRGGQGAMPDLTFAYGTTPQPSIQPLTNFGGWVLNQRGVSLLDVDGDGLADLFQLDSTFRRYRKNLGNGAFAQPQNYTGADPTTASSAQLADVDGDSRADLVTIIGSSWRVAHWTGSGWSNATAWANSRLVPTSGSDTALADLNGDGRTDVLTAVTSGMHVFFGGNGQLVPVSLPPISSGDPQVQPGASNVRLHDVNGDGLADVVWLADHSMQTYLGRGDGTFVRSVLRAYPWPEVADLGNTLLADVNRDGLVDLLRFSNGNLSWYRGLPGFDFCPTPVQVARPDIADRDAIVALADIYGSGAQQVVWSSPRGMWALDLAGAVSSAMLTRIDNGLGRATSFDYSASGVLSAAARAAGAPWNSDSPLSIPVPLRMSIDPGGGEPLQTVEYTVRDPFWDFAESRFGGFLVGRERQMAAVGTTVEITFEPGLGDRRVLRGQPLVRRTYDDKGQPVLAQTFTRDTVALTGLGPSPLARVGIIVAETQEHFEGVPQSLVTRTEYAHDAEGRVTEERRLGRVDLSGDESTRFTAWASDDTTWVRDKIVTEGIKSADGTVLRTSRHYYGDASAMLPLGQVGSGWLRKTESLLHDTSRGDVWRDEEESQYDAVGNVIAHFDGIAWRQRFYDDSGLFIVQERMTTGGRALSWSATWDAVLAVPTSLTGPNGETSFDTYDALGRVASRAHVAGRPYLLHAYDWSAPKPRTITRLYEGDEKTMPPFAGWQPGSGWREAVEVTNGSGEHILTATRLAADRLLVDKYTLRDERGHTVFRAEPFEYAGSDVPASLPAGAAGASFSYDALGRTARTVVATGAARTSVFSAFTVVTTTDGLAPVTTRLDGLGRVAHTERLINGTVESVDAEYDASSAITRLSLQNGAVAHAYSYDSLGRLVGTRDPDSGTRVLRYNDANELVQQVNGAGELINYEYDDIGRVTAIRTADGRAFVYHYDLAKDGSASGSTLGRVAWIEEPTGGVELAYDGEGRVVVSRRVVNGRSLQEQHRYSPAGNLLGVSFDDGFAFDVSYDDAGRAVKAGDFWSALRLDARGAVAQGQFGNGVIETFDRDAVGQSTHLRIARSSGAALYDVTAARNATGAITSMTDSDGVGLDHSATFGYDAAGRVTQATIGGSARQYQFGYAWDGLQNLVSRAATGPKAIGTFPGKYVYGENGASPRQLTRVKADGKEIVMAYDPAGRMTRQGDFTAAYNAFDELVKVLDATGKTVATHDYGYDGLRTHTRNADGSEQLWLDADVTEKSGRREHSVEIAGRAVAKVVYQIGSLPSPATGPLVGGVVRGLGARIERLGATLKAASASASEMLVLCLGAAWILASLRARRRRRVPRPALAMVGLATTLMACGAHGPLDGRQSASLSSPERVYFHQGFSAGPVLFTRADGSVEEERTFEPFGAPLDAYRESGGAGTSGDVDFGVESRNELNSETDPNTNWTYQGARWMLPQLARWASPDPPTKAPDPKFLFAPWDLNPYAYARANPVIFWDPDGQSWKSFAVGFVKGAVTAVATTVVFAAAATVAPVAVAVVGGVLLAKGAYDLYQGRHEIAAVGHRIASGTTTDADHEMFGNVVGGFVGAGVGLKVAAKLLKPPPKWGGCFVAGTPILTARGLVPIETIAVGDLVWSLDAETGAEGWKPVLRTVIHDDEHLVDVTIRDEEERDETITATPDHPFWVEGRGWTPAGRLAPLDRVVQPEGRHGTVVAAVARAETARVFNFEVEGWHSYFVGNESTLVHNNDCFAKQDGATIKLKRPSGVSDEAWQGKIDKLNAAAESGEAKVVHNPTRSGAAQKAARKDGLIQPGHDADHALDLQYGGKDELGNITSTDSRVNRSVGGQGKQRMQYPDGTPIKEFVSE